MLSLRLLCHHRHILPRSVQWWPRHLSNGAPSTDEEVSSSTLDYSKAIGDAAARGLGQVIFLNSPVSGGILLGGLAVGDPYLASLCALGGLTATAVAKGAGMDSGAFRSGLWGYNGCLVGCAAAVFGPSSILAATTSTIVGAAATPLVAASLNETMKIPQWTFAFNIVTLTGLLYTRPLMPSLPSTGNIGTIDAATTVAPGIFDISLSPLTGISQIFVVESALSGAVILSGIGIYSPGLACHAVAGSAIGTAVGAIMGADLSDLAMGLWGFNSALTSMAVGTFFVHSWPTMALSAGGAAATAAVFGSMSSVFGAYGSPCLTLPFCFSMSACYLLHNQIPVLVLAKNPTSPEKNE